MHDSDDTPKKRGRKSLEQLSTQAQGRKIGYCVSCTSNQDGLCANTRSPITVIKNPHTTECALWTSDELPLGNTALAAPGQSPEAVTPTTAQAERDMANQLLGRIQLAQGVSKLVTVTSLIDLQKIKESKSYRHLVAEGSDGKLVTVTSWEEFCGLLGVSREKVDKDLINLQAFGAEALESMRRAGLGYRELRKLRKLPEEDRMLIVQDVEADVGDKESILQLIDDLSAKHAKEKTKLETAIAASQREAKATEKVLADKEKKIRELHKELEETKEKPMGRDEVVAAWGTKVSGIADAITWNSHQSLAVLGVVFHQIVAEYEKRQEDIPPPLRRAMAGALQRVRADADALADEYGLWHLMDEIAAVSDQPARWSPGMTGPDFSKKTN
jgi:hypothetical protein